jgi:hypothetical protein
MRRSVASKPWASLRVASVPCHISHSPPTRYLISRANCRLISLSAIAAVNCDYSTCWQAVRMNRHWSKVSGRCLYFRQFYTMLCWKLSTIESRLSELINDRGGSDNRIFGLNSSPPPKKHCYSAIMMLWTIMKIKYKKI